MYLIEIYYINFKWFSFRWLVKSSDSVDELNVSEEALLSRLNRHQLTNDFQRSAVVGLATGGVFGDTVQL